jgi:hypothetical protein
VGRGGLVVAGCQITTTSTGVDLSSFKWNRKSKGDPVPVDGGCSGVTATLDIHVSKNGNMCNTESLSGQNAVARVTTAPWSERFGVVGTPSYPGPQCDPLGWHAGMEEPPASRNLEAARCQRASGAGRFAKGDKPE